MKKTLLTLALVLAAGGAQAVTLTSLLEGGSITAGDKLFTDWTEVFFDASDANRTLDTDNIDVTAIEDGGDYGLEFSVLDNEMKVAGDGVYAYLDYMFGFKVTATGAGMQITGNWLSISAGAIGSEAEGDAGMTILEWAGDELVTDPAMLGYISTEFSVLDGEVLNSGPDSSSFAPVSSLWVTKNILVWASAEGESANLIGFSQRFKQAAIPEPATLALFGLGLLGLGFARRRAA